MKRGDIVTIAASGDYGKPRPALVVQSDLFNATHASISVLPMTSTLVAAPLFRIDLEPSRKNGLKLASQIMVDKCITLPADKIGRVVGSVGDDLMLQVSRSLSVWLGIA
jgi:mRNA interferase MazF